MQNIQLMTEIGTETCKTVRILVSLQGWYHYPVTDPNLVAVPLAVSLIVYQYHKIPQS